jgi:hypothetical protein
MLAPSIVAEALEILQYTGVVHTKLMPPVNNIRMVRRHQVLPSAFIGHTLLRIAVDILTPVRGVRLIYQYDSKEIIYGMLV